MKLPLLAVLVVVGLTFAAIGIVYLVEPARHLPTFFPGHSHSRLHGFKHGVVALGVGALAILFAIVYRPRSRARIASQ
jgi:hypothetical protein